MSMCEKDQNLPWGYDLFRDPFAPPNGYYGPPPGYCDGHCCDLHYGRAAHPDETQLHSSQLTYDLYNPSVGIYHPGSTHEHEHETVYVEPSSSPDGSGNRIVLGKDKRRKKECLVTLDLEEGNKSDMSKIGKKTESKKKMRKERNNIGIDLRQNAPAGEGKNGKGNKEKKVCENKNDGDDREKENMAKRKDKGRRVSFTDDVEVFNIGGSDDVEGDGSGETELVHGRRFTSEEDAMLMEAMVKYAEMKQLGEKGLEMIGDCIKNPELRGCWVEIAKSLPHRPAKAVYKRARILLQRSAERKWTEEEYEIVRRFVEKNGRNWRVLAKELGKNEIHVKDTWRRIKPKNLKRGPWTQDEYQNLFDLVPPSNLHTHLGDLLSNKRGADVVFEVGGETYPAHRCVLAARSPVFAVELFSSMRESDAAGGVVHIDDMEPQVFHALLHFAYTDTLPEMRKPEEGVLCQHLLVAADRYDMERLKLICEDKLCRYIDVGTAAIILALAEQHRCHSLKKACIDFLSAPANLKAVVAGDGFEHLSTSCPSITKDLLAMHAS